jgi:hypothetical protein
MWSRDPYLRYHEGSNDGQRLVPPFIDRALSSVQQRTTLCTSLHSISTLDISLTMLSSSSRLMSSAYAGTSRNAHRLLPQSSRQAVTTCRSTRKGKERAVDSCATWNRTTLREYTEASYVPLAPTNTRYNNGQRLCVHQRAFHTSARRDALPMIPVAAAIFKVSCNPTEADGSRRPS